MADRPLHGKTVLVGVTGSIAAYKSVYLVRRLVEAGASVHVAMTAAAARFVTPLTFRTVSGNPVLTDLYEMEEPSGHVKLAERLDAAVVAPCTANTLARYAAGIADDALGTLLIAHRGPVLLAPAMDGGMWTHPATRDNVKTLEKRGVFFSGPEAGSLASGLSGVGRMTEPDDILAQLLPLLDAAGGGKAGDLAGEHVLVTAGPTREHIDPVRYLSNPSTGRMGFAVAEAAARRGARVTLIAGPVDLPTPEGVTRIDVTSAADMEEAVYTQVKRASVLVMAAAVSDFTPRVSHEHKVKKGSAKTDISFVPTADILAGLDAHAPQGLYRIGFAAETRNVAAYARKKLLAKGLDLIVANDLTRPDSGFGTATNRVLLIDRSGAEEALPTLEKRQVADALLDRVAGRGSVRFLQA